MLEEIPYEDADGIVRRLLDSANKASESIDPANFKSLPECTDCNRVAAVDGGSAVLYDMGSLLIGVLRAGYLVYEDRELVHEHISPLRLVAVDKANSQEVYKKACQDMDVPIHEPPQELDAFIRRMMYLSEMRLALDALGHLKKGDVLLVDGSLRADISRPVDILKTVLDQASARDVDVAGVSKSSQLNIDGLPLLSMAQHRARRLGIGSWVYPLGKDDSHEHGEVSIACFHPRASHAFRVDIAGRQEAVGALKFYADDPSLLGYPSPLSAIHNRVAIPRATAEGIGMVLETRLSTLPEAGGWTGLLTDFHSLLDMGV